jgi:hypothetical protein
MKMALTFVWVVARVCSSFTFEILSKTLATANLEVGRRANSV